MKRKPLWIGLLVLAALVIGLGEMARREVPKLKEWTREQLEKVSREQLPVHLSVAEIELNIVPLGVTLHHLHVDKPDNSLGVNFDPFTINSVHLQLSLFNLVQGRLRLHKVTLQGLHLNVSVPKQQKKNSEKPLAGLFQNLDKIPLRELEIEDLNLNFELAEPRFKGEIDSIHLLVENKFLNVGVNFSAAGMKLKDEDSNSSLNLQVESQFLLEPYDITIGALKVRCADSYVVASGRLKGDTEALRFDSYNLKGRSFLNLEPLREWLVKTVSDYRNLPQLKGLINIEGSLRKEKNKLSLWNTDLSTEKLQIDQFYVDRLKATAVFQNDRVQLTQAKLTNPGGELTLKETEVKMSAPAPGSVWPASAQISTNVELRNGQLHEVFQSLGLKKIALWSGLHGEVPCQGSLTPNFNLECTGTLSGEDFILKSSPDSKKSIVEFNSFSTKGSLHVTDKAVSYLTELEMPKSKGFSQGVIDYAKGFKIEFEGSPLEIADLKDFAGLKLEGSLKVKGSTEGDGHAATFKADLEATNLWLDNYWLGSDVKSSLAYADGNLIFSDLKGFYPASRYTGRLVLNLRQNLIDLDGEVPFFEAKDLLQIFSRKVQLPFTLTGTGQAKISVTGPLEFTALSYDLKSSLFRGTVYGEAFDQADFNVHATAGQVYSDKVAVQRGNSSMTLTGRGYPDGLIDTKVAGHNLRLEDSVNLSALGMNLSGQFDFDMTMKGPVLSPETQLAGKITKMAIGDQGVADSDLHLKLSSTHIDGDGSFLGNALQAKFVIPLKPDAPFKLDASAENWNFTPIFAPLSIGLSRKDFETQLTAQVHLASPHGGFWQSSGQLSASQFLIRRGNLSMSSAKELQITMQNGQIRFPQFYLEGDNTFLKISDLSPRTSDTTTKDPINAQVNGRLDMNLLGLFLPFFEDLRGTLSFTFSAKGEPSNLNFIGSAYIEKGFLKLFDFPHPFEDFKADVLFNEKKILVNSIRGSFAGGRFGGDGLLEVKGYKNLPLDFNIHLDHVNLNFPDQMKTRGSADLNFTGNWFPFHMQGTYDIAGGEISKEFTAGSDRNSVKRSYFLPDFLLKENFQPLTMDLKIDFAKGVQVNNSLMRGRVMGEIKIGGTPSTPTILGTVTAEKDGKVFFNETEFSVVSGVFEFTDPKDINPTLYLSAVTRLQDYDITLIVSGTAHNPKIVLSSQPALSQADIVSLLALGSTNNNHMASLQQGSTASFSVGSAILKQNPIGRELKDRFGVDLQFTSSVDDTDSVALQKIAITGKISKKLSWDYNRVVGSQSADEAHLRYRLTNRFSVVGSYEDQEFSEIANTQQVDVQHDNVFGLDLEYRFEFK